MAALECSYSRTLTISFDLQHPQISRAIRRPLVNPRSSFAHPSGCDQLIASSSFHKLIDRLRLLLKIFIQNAVRWEYTFGFSWTPSSAVTVRVPLQTTSGSRLFCLRRLSSKRLRFSNFISPCGLSFSVEQRPRRPDSYSDCRSFPFRCCFQGAAPACARTLLDRLSWVKAVIHSCCRSFRRRAKREATSQIRGICNLLGLRRNLEKPLYHNTYSDSNLIEG
ncbi:hypothetical protein R3P38DRAFT_1725520 [Favolaschia claudopus]|uniref:Uncharacterized protein n=1 Tax=Favolaschia claudopus TaxID=2862362 RepID=A0AAW0AA49_9AGAR